MTSPQPPAGPEPGALLTAIDYPVFFVPERAAAAVKVARRFRNGRILSLVFSLLILGVLYYFLRDQWGPISVPMVVIVLAIPLIFLTVAVVREVRARRAASRVTHGLALGICRNGVWVADRWLPWAQMNTITACRGRFGGSDRLVFAASDDQGGEVALAYLSELPATVDNAIKALSGMRHGIDFTRLDA